MKSRSSILMMTGAVLLVLSGSSSADSLRCKSDLAAIGDSKASILQKCGEPMHRDSFCKPAAQPTSVSFPSSQTTVNVAACEKVDEWTYNPGYGQFLTTLRFESGNLVSIRYGDRVK